jgi:Tol biopolymer transport system component
VRSREPLSAPAGSPDSKLIAAAVSAPAPSKATSVQLHDAATGAPVRKLADNAGASSFSPDGKQVAYGAADGWIYVVSVRGGKARRLVRGISPAWGGGDPPGAAVASTSLR